MAQQTLTCDQYFKVWEWNKAKSYWKNCLCLLLYMFRLRLWIRWKKKRNKVIGEYWLIIHLAEGFVYVSFFLKDIYPFHWISERWQKKIIYIYIYIYKRMCINGLVSRKNSECLKIILQIFVIWSYYYVFC